MHSPESLVAFSELHPWAQGWPPGMVLHLLRLVSSDSLVLEIFDGSDSTDGRVAAAVLVDKINNPGHLASLEVLGVRADADSEKCFSRLLAMARERLPSGFNGFEVCIPSTLTGREDLIRENKLEPYYETFGMIHDSPGTSSPPPPGLCTIVTDRDEAELYRVLSLCFEQNVDTNIPSFEDWQAARRMPSRSKTWGIWQEKKLVAFCNLAVPREIPVAEIRTVGVLPEYRGRGFAQALIRRALGFTAQLEIPSCLLTVAIHNRNALSLYHRLGFRDIDHRPVFRWKV